MMVFSDLYKETHTDYEDKVDQALCVSFCSVLGVVLFVEFKGSEKEYQCLTITYKLTNQLWIAA